MLIHIKQIAMLTNILTFDHEANEAIDLGSYYQDIMNGTEDLRDRIARSKFINEERISEIEALNREIELTIRQVIQSGGED